MSTEKESSFYNAVYNIDSPKLVKLQDDVEDFLKNFPDDHISVDCLNRAFSNMNGGEFKSLKDLRPDMEGISLGDGIKKKLSSIIEKDLKKKKKKLSSTIDQGNLEVQARDKLNKKEAKALMTRYLLGLAVDLRKSEFDILVTLKVDNLCIFIYSHK